MFSLFGVMIKERGGIASEKRGKCGREGNELRRGDGPCEKGVSVAAETAALHSGELKAG